MKLLRVSEAAETSATDPPRLWEPCCDISTRRVKQRPLAWLNRTGAMPLAPGSSGSKPVAHGTAYAPLWKAQSSQEAQERASMNTPQFAMTPVQAQQLRQDRLARL